MLNRLPAARPALGADFRLSCLESIHEAGDKAVFRLSGGLAWRYDAESGAISVRLHRRRGQVAKTYPRRRPPASLTRRSLVTTGFRGAEQ